MLNWIFWSVPRDYVGRYVFTMWLVMFFLPGFIFGLQFTKIGFIINLLWYDIIFYGWYRLKERLGGN